MRSYCGREERQVPLRFPSASAPVSLHKFSPTSKIWVSRFCLDSTLALSLPNVRSLKLHEKTASPAGYAQKSITKGEIIRTQTFQEL